MCIEEQEQVAPTLKMKIKAVPSSPAHKKKKAQGKQKQQTTTKNGLQTKDETTPYFFNKHNTDLLLDTYKKHSNKMNNGRYRKKNRFGKLLERIYQRY